jgi:AAHS family 4-hydroxybenzoate transporter-like MFS transporter
MTPTLDIRLELDALPLNARHWSLVIALGFVTLFDGYDVFAPAYVIPYAIKAWSLSPSQAGLLVSSGLVGFMIGALANGPIADRFGRKPTLLIGLLLAAILNLCTACWARSFELFMAMRLLTGLGLGVLLPLSVTLINEIAPRSATNLLVGCMMVGWSAGGVLAALISAAFAPIYGWPSIFWFAGIAVPLVVICTRVLRESPRFLVMRGRQDDAYVVMSWLAPRKAREYRQGFALREDTAHKGSLRRLLAPELLRGTVVVWLCAGCSLFAIYGLSSWVPQAMIRNGETLRASFGFGALLQVMAIIGGVVCGAAADAMSRLKVLATTWLIGAAAITGLAFTDLHWAKVLFVAVAGFCVMGAQPVLNNFTAALYSTEIRSTGVGAELGVGRLGGIFGPYAGGWLQQTFPGTLALYLSLALALVLSSASLLFVRDKIPKPAKPERE